MVEIDQFINVAFTAKVAGIEKKWDGSLLIVAESTNEKGNKIYTEVPMCYVEPIARDEMRNLDGHI